MPSRKAIAQAVSQLAKSGRTVLFSSHYPDEISSLASRVLLLRNGVLSEKLVDSFAENSAENIYRLMFE